jgi:hypothetical protein
MTTTDQQAIQVIDSLKGGHDIAGRLSQLPGDDGAAVVLVDLTQDGGEPARRWVVDGSVAVIGALADLAGAPAATGRRPVTILVWTPEALEGEPARRAAAEAAVEAMRGIAHTAALEESTAALRINVVVGRETVADDALRTVAHLSSPDAGFIVGATFDLRGS